MDYNNILNKDCKSLGPTPQRSPLRRRSIHAMILGAAAVVGVLALLQPADNAAAIRHESITQALNLPLPETTVATRSAEPLAQVAEAPWQEVTVRPGDTLSAIFDRLQLGATELHAMMNADRSMTATLRQLQPGQVLRFQVDEVRQQLNALHYGIDELTTLALERSDEGFTARHITRQVENRLAYSSATIDTSLFAAGQRAGLSDGLIMELATIFGWDIDFALDIRSGDSFTLLYEQAYLDGEYLRDGSILAAEFINQGQVYRAIRFVDANGNANFYTPDGLSMRKAFLRSPVDFNRISSGFQPERFHPVLGIKRPHRGVDYAAAIGTPIKASGDGRIEFIGTKGGYGKTVILQHGGAYRTLYAHMSRFHPGLRSGTRVKQGQIIGYVGKTGIATGPHLHYEFLVNGVHRNPLTVKLPTAAPLPAQYREAFQQQARLRLAQLEAVKQTMLAMNNR
ncbi:MAG: peptidoglycan DD-metalloendopeptidase family protein [Thiohalomonadaceae bacterium]